MPYATDWRRRYFGAALCVVKPSNTEEVAQAVKICAQAGVPIVPVPRIRRVLNDVDLLERLGTCLEGVQI